MQFYRNLYKDLDGLNDDELTRHYLQAGRREKRFRNLDEAIKTLELQDEPLPADFDEEDYLKLHDDVRQSFSFPGGAAIHYLWFGRAEGRHIRKKKLFYDEHLLHLMTNRVYDLPDIVVDAGAPIRVNVLVPAFEFKSMSAGFFGVFQVARFIASLGFRVRLLMFDNFYWNEAEFREKLLGYPGMERLFDELEVEYVGRRTAPIVISPKDNCVATVWYSAYLAEKIMRTAGGGAFLYLIQDYESQFHPGGTLWSLAQDTYDMEYDALFSTQPLQDFFVSRRIGAFGSGSPRHTFFNNACSSRLPPLEAFVAPRPAAKRRLALYCRPEVNRNMFELAALALCQAVRAGVFQPGGWEFYGVGLGDVRIQLGPDVSLVQLERMDLKAYQNVISTFDVGLCLMASPHPSLLPFDLAGSGAVVVTNLYATKVQTYFDAISPNILACPPTRDGLVDGLRQAVQRVDDREQRYRGAATMAYPRNWGESLGPEHADFLSQTFAGSRP